MATTKDASPTHFHLRHTCIPKGTRHHLVPPHLLASGVLRAGSGPLLSLLTGTWPPCHAAIDTLGSGLPVYIQHRCPAQHVLPYPFTCIFHTDSLSLFSALQVSHLVFCHPVPSLNGLSCQLPQGLGHLSPHLLFLCQTLKSSQES